MVSLWVFMHSTVSVCLCVLPVLAWVLSVSWSVRTVSGECLGDHALGSGTGIAPVFHPRQLQEDYFTQHGQLLHASLLVTLGGNLALLSSEFIQVFFDPC